MNCCCSLAGTKACDNCSVGRELDSTGYAIRYIPQKDFEERLEYLLDKYADLWKEMSQTDCTSSKDIHYETSESF